MAYYKQGPDSQAGLAVIKDKPVVDPRDRWGFADRVSVGSGASATWSNTLGGGGSLASLYVNDIDEEPDVRDLPRAYIEINKKETRGVGLADGEINDSISNTDITDNKVDLGKAKEKGTFTTGDYKRITDLSSLSLGVYLPDPDHIHGTKSYFPLQLPLKAEDIKVFEEEGEGSAQKRGKYAVYQYAGLKRTLSSAVLIHNDAELEKYQEGELIPVSIIAVRGTRGDDCDDLYCGTLKEILYIDSSAGLIDTSHLEVMPWDTEKALGEKQGLLMDYKKELDYGSGAKITVRETKGGISTTTESSAKQTIIRKIRLNQPDDTGKKEVEVPVTFSSNQIGTYGVTYENK